MDVHPEQCFLNNPATPGVSNLSLWRNEDSGYHTFTPSSFDSSVTYNESLDANHQKDLRIAGQITVDCYSITPLGRKLCQTQSLHTSSSETPVPRRGTKRRYNENVESPNTPNSSVPTPTSAIAGGIQRLKVNDDSCIDINISVSSVRSDTTHNVVNNLYYIGDYAHTSYPTTPVKKVCRPNCKLSPSKRSLKKINFAIHSLSCESQGLDSSNKAKRPRSQSKAARTIQFRPDQKIDIIKMLSEKTCVWPALNKIVSYLSNKDIYNFTLVSPTWLQVWEQVSNAKKLGYSQYLKERKENSENCNKSETPRVHDNSQMRSLKDIYNVLNTDVVIKTQASPPGTPRTIRFKKFIKSASLDNRIQMACVRCCQPSKVSEEPDGEEWVECTSITCSYQFCRFCKCKRHPGKVCFQYDLEGSPSKRMKYSYGPAVGSKKSRKNLRRLL